MMKKAAGWLMLWLITTVLMGTIIIGFSEAASEYTFTQHYGYSGIITFVVFILIRVFFVAFDWITE